MIDRELAILVGQGNDRLASVARLRADDDVVQTAFDTGTLALLDAPAPGAGRLSLDRVFPNPVRDDLKLTFVLPAAGEATVELVDLAGRRVLARSLGELAAGPHDVALDGAGRARSPGVYFLRLTHANATVTKRVVLSH